MATFEIPRPRFRRCPAPGRTRLRHLAPLVLALTAGAAVAQKPLGQVGDDGGEISVRIESLFSEIPPHGYLPLRVTIENNTLRDISLVVETTSQDNRYWRGENTSGSAFRLGSKAGQDTEHEILAPLVSTFTRHGGYGGSGSSVTIRVTGGGLPDRQIGNHSDFMAHMASVALSTESHQLDWEAVKTALHGTSSGGSPPSGTFGARFAPERLPAHWRGLSGFDVIVFRGDEWAKVTPTARAAVLDWVRMGGRLVLWGENGQAADPAALGIEGVQGKRLGLGTVEGLAGRGSGGGNANLIGPEQLVGGPRRANGFIAAVTNDYVGNPSPLQRSLGTRAFNSAQVILILIAFAVLVGPVNLFVLAKPGRRHRLFVTTPILSIAAGLAIAALIFIQDGIGGKGVRASVTFIDSGARKSYTTQEQIARTGVLLGRSFAVAEPLVLTPVVLNTSRWTFVDNESNGNRLGYQEADQTFSGDWFRSRSEQGHLARWVRETRESVQVLAAETGPEGQPVVLSTLAYPLGRLAYFDAEGVVWSGENIVTGEKATLSRWDPAAFREWWHGGLEGFGPSLIEAASGVFTAAATGHFFAVAAENGTPPMLDTLDSIRWTNQRALVFGITETIGKGGPPAP